MTHVVQEYDVFKAAYLILIFGQFSFIIKMELINLIEKNFKQNKRKKNINIYENFFCLAKLKWYREIKYTKHIRIFRPLSLMQEKNITL